MGTIKSLICLEDDVKTDIVERYEIEITVCKSDIGWLERKGA